MPASLQAPMALSQFGRAGKDVGVLHITQLPDLPTEMSQPSVTPSKPIATELAPIGSWKKVIVEISKCEKCY